MLRQLSGADFFPRVLLVIGSCWEARTDGFNEISAARLNSCVPGAFSMRSPPQTSMNWNRNVTGGNVLCRKTPRFRGDRNINPSIT